MAQALITNNARSLLAASITDVATTATVTTGTGSLFPNPTGGDYFYITFETTDGTTREIAKCTGRSGDVLTLVRGQDGTAGTSFVSGSKAELRINRAVITDSVTTATTAASAAASSASAAATSASASATSATNSATSATNSANSATASAASATAAAASAATATDAAIAMAIALG